MTTSKKFNLDKMVKDAQKRLATHIDKLVKKAHQETSADFAESRKLLKIK